MVNIVLGFKIWYSNNSATGRSYDDWVNCPDDDVQVVMLYIADPDSDVPLRRIASGNDFYGLDEVLQLTQGDDESKLHGHIKRGKRTDNKTLEKLQAEAMRDSGEGWLWQPAPAQPPARGGA